MPSLESSPLAGSMDLPLQTRVAQFNGVNLDKREITFSFSSEAPAQKLFGTEILSHSPGSVITSRLDKKAVNLLLDHDWTKSIGKIQSYHIEEGRAYATAKISRSPLASEILMDVADGLRTEVSVGYIIHEMKMIKSDEKDGDTYLVSLWEPLELSLVSVPSDASVGIGRTADTKTYSVRVLGGDEKKPLVKENQGANPRPSKEESIPLIETSKLETETKDADMVTCPGCGFEFPFPSGGTMIAICPSCGMEFGDGDDDDTGKSSSDGDEDDKRLSSGSKAIPEINTNTRSPATVTSNGLATPGSYSITYTGNAFAPTVATSNSGTVTIGPATETKTDDAAKSEVLPAAPAIQERSVITENRTSKNQDMAEPTAENTRVDVLKENEEALSKIRDTEHARIREITALGAKFDCVGDANEWIRRGKTIQEFHTHILNNKVFATAPIRSIDPSLGMRPTEQKRYSLTRAILAHGEGKMSGFELECSKEIEAQVGRKATGFFVPEFAFTNMGRRSSPPDLTALATHEGPELIQTTVEPSLIPFLRNKMVLGRAGCTMMGGLVGNMALPRQISAATATWNTENFDPTRTGQTFDQVPLNPQRLSAVTAFSKQLLAQSQIDVQVVVRDDLLKIIAIAQDLAGLNGTGLSNQPLGILNTTADTVFPSAYAKTSPSVTFASGYPTWTNVVTFEGNVESNNIDLDDPSCCYIASPAVKALWKTLAKADPRSTTLFYPQFIWEDEGEVGRVNGYRALSTQQLGATNQVIFGKFSDLVIGTWGGIDLLTDPYTLASSYQIRVIINLLTTIAIRYGPAFCYSTNSGLV